MQRHRDVSLNLEDNAHHMKRNGIIIGGVAIALLLIVLIVMQMGGKEPAAPSGGSTEVPDGNFPIPGDLPDNGTVSLSAASGGTVNVRNFQMDPGTVEDPQNAGHFYLGYHTMTGVATPATKNPSYTIDFMSQTQFFNITLLKLPLGAARKEAEEFLKARLGIPESELCALKYSVAVPAFVNEDASGTNLKFSFCPGAVQLP